MKTTIAIVMTLSLMLVLGCDSPQGGQTPTGAGLSPQGGGMPGGEGFRISTPASTTIIKQGETQNVTVSLDRGTYFKRDVTLEMRPSKGISVEPTKTVVKGNEAPDVQLRITVAKDADLGTYKIFVKGSPETGEATSTEITVKVVAP